METWLIDTRIYMVGLVAVSSISPQVYSESFRSALTKFLNTSCIPVVANSTPQGLPMSNSKYYVSNCNTANLFLI